MPEYFIQRIKKTSREAVNFSNGGTVILNEKKIMNRELWNIIDVDFVVVWFNGINKFYEKWKFYYFL